MTSSEDLKTHWKQELLKEKGHDCPDCAYQRALYAAKYGEEYDA